MLVSYSAYNIFPKAYYYIQFTQQGGISGIIWCTGNHEECSETYLPAFKANSLRGIYGCTIGWKIQRENEIWSLLPNLFHGTSALTSWAIFHHKWKCRRATEPRTVGNTYLYSGELSDGLVYEEKSQNPQSVSDNWISIHSFWQWIW